MRNVFWPIVVNLFGTVITFGQQPAPAPSPPPAPASTPNTNRIPSRISRSGLPPFNAVGTSAGFGSPIEADPMARRMMLVQKYAVPMYRKPTGKELKPLAPDSAITAKYSELLRKNDSGIFKLVPDSGCAESTKVVNASEKCLKYLFPGAANSFSFRTGNYRVRQLADITYVAGGFWTTGVLMHGLMVDLGDIPLEQVTARTPAIAFINNFQPMSDFTEAMAVDKLLTDGVRRDGYLYRRNLPVASAHTFVIRAIAYQGRVMRAVKGAAYNELDFDKRNDVTVAFRVERIDYDGAVTIVWTKLSSARSPKLKVPSNEDPAKFIGKDRGTDDSTDDPQ
ncbi:MAG: hypothetical protein ABI791_07305 [Acidobacteriota bacterium]